MLGLTLEIGAAQSDVVWLRDVPATTIQMDSALRLPNPQRFAKWAVEELGVAARPVLEVHDNAFRERAQDWLTWLGKIDAGESTNVQLRASTSGATADGEDSLHQLTMDLRRQLAGLEHSLTTEEIDGVHVWQVSPEDRARITVFICGLSRITPLRFDHTGLGTIVTRDRDKFLLQNDIGAIDAYVLVVQVQVMTATVNYADLRRQRFESFRLMPELLDVHREGLQSKFDPVLNEGQPFIFSIIRPECGNGASLDNALEGIGSRIVFLVDRNHARKCLLLSVRRDATVGIPQEATRIDAGYMAWFKCGGKALIRGAIQIVGAGVLRVGDRFDAVFDAADACCFLIDVLRLASQVMPNDQPVTQLADQTRLLSTRSVRLYDSEFELLEKYAAYCHTLAQSVSDALEHDVMNTSCTQPNSGAGVSVTQRLAAHAESWEREADELMTLARGKVQRQPRWGRSARVIEFSNDTADALEEAVFLMGLIADGHQTGWNDVICDVLCRLARTVQAAVQEHIEALATVHDLAGRSSMSDSNAFVAATWNMLHAERQCDELLRQAWHLILASMKDVASLMLVNGLAQVLELTSDRLLAASHMLRDAMFNQAEQV